MNYPHIIFRRNWEISHSTYFLLGQIQAIIESISNFPLDPNYHRKLLNISLIKGAQATTAIEGNTLTEEEIKKVNEGKSLPASKEYQQIEVKNVIDAYNKILDDLIVSNNDNLITPKLIKEFHRMIGQNLGDHFNALPGSYRNHLVSVGTYRPPDNKDIPELLEKLCEWLRKEFNYESRKQSMIDTIVEAIVAHVYIEWIHPFGDGNGRTGRLVEFYVLLRAGIPDIASHILSNFYNQTRVEYYRQLQLANDERSLSKFINYALMGLLDGLRSTLETLQESYYELAWKKFIYDRFAEKKYNKKEVYKRRRRVILNLPLGEKKSIEHIQLLTPEIAATYAKLNKRTLQRDLDDLMEMDLVNQHPDKTYSPNDSLLKGQKAQRRKF